MRKAAIYARISQDREGAGHGVKRQVADCEAEAKRRGWTVAEIYVDDDISAYSGKTRPAYQRLLRDLAEGYRDAVIVWHLDRLHRQPKELEGFVEVCTAAGTKVASLYGDFDLGDGDGLLMARIMAAVGAKESQDKSRRVRRKMQEVAEQGRPHGGVRPFGFHADRTTLRPDEAKIIAEVANRFIAGESLASLTKWLNDQGVDTPGKSPTWRTTTLRGILRSGRISGQREHNGEIVGPAQWDPIITPEQTTRIRAILDDPRRRTNRTARAYLLAGMLRCHACGVTMVSHPRSGVRRYVCKKGADHDGCGSTYIVAERVEQLISDAVLSRLDTPELADALAGRHRDDDHASGLAEEIALDQAQLDELAVLWANREISVGEWGAARSTIEGRLREAKRALAQASDTTDVARYVGAGQDLRNQWSELALTRRAAIIAAVLDHAVIGPGTGNRFDRSRVQPVWKL